MDAEIGSGLGGIKQEAGAAAVCMHVHTCRWGDSVFGRTSG